MPVFDEGATLKRRRVILDLTQEYLSMCIGCSRNYLSECESGRKKPRPAVLRKWHRSLEKEEEREGICPRCGQSPSWPKPCRVFYQGRWVDAQIVGPEIYGLWAVYIPTKEHPDVPEALLLVEKESLREKER